MVSTPGLGLGLYITLIILKVAYCGQFPSPLTFSSKIHLHSIEYETPSPECHVLGSGQNLCSSVKLNALLLTSLFNF